MYVEQCLKTFKNSTVEQGNGHLLEVISSLRKIVNHPYLFFKFHQKNSKEQAKTNMFNTVRNINIKDVPEHKRFVEEQAASSTEINE